MADSDVTLAWRNGEGSGDLYKASDLSRPDRITEMFAACKISEGYITADGWEFLFSVWKMEELLDFDLTTGWFHTAKVEEAPAHLIFQSLMAGYNPLTSEKGDYEPETGLFLSHDGRKSQVDWADY